MAMLFHSIKKKHFFLGTPIFGKQRKCAIVLIGKKNRLAGECKVNNFKIF
jgi:hypothetical protein